MEHGLSRHRSTSTDRHLSIGSCMLVTSNTKVGVADDRAVVDMRKLNYMRMVLVLGIIF